MEQLGDKIKDGFGLQCFAKTHFLLSPMLLPEATCLIFALWKLMNKSPNNVDAPPLLGRAADPPSTPVACTPAERTPVPVGPVPPPQGSNAPLPSPHHETRHPTCALLRGGF